MTDKKKGRSPWPYGIAIGLGIVVVVNGAMIAIASHNAPVLETEKYYTEALEYETVLEAHRASAALGFSSTLAVDGLQVEWAVLDASGAAVTGLKGTTSLRRADTKTFDASLDLKEIRPGIYAAQRAPGTGLFRLTLKLEGAAAPLLAEQRIYLP